MLRKYKDKKKFLGACLVSEFGLFVLMGFSQASLK